MNEKINKSKDMQPILDAMLEVSKEKMNTLIGDCLSNATLGVFAGKFFSKKIMVHDKFLSFQKYQKFLFLQIFKK